MIILDKSFTGNTFIFITATETGLPVTTGLTLNITNISTNVEYVLTLGSDTSSYPQRYNKYQVPSFSGIPDGKYVYIINNSNNKLIEEGLLECNSEILTQEEIVDEEYIYQVVPSTDDDYIVDT